MTKPKDLHVMVSYRWTLLQTSRTNNKRDEASYVGLPGLSPANNEGGYIKTGIV